MRRAALIFGAMLFEAVLLAACSSNESDGAGGATGAAGPGATGATGAAKGQATGSGFLDQTGAGSGVGGSGCGAISERASTIQPADIIVGVDTTTSMWEELPWVQENVNVMVDTIVASGIDARLIVIGGYELCVPAPLGSGQCNGMDGNPPKLVRIFDNGGGEAILWQFALHYPEYKSFLRPDASKTFVVITDENAVIRDAEEFTAEILALDPPTFAGFKFDGIYPFSGFDPATCPYSITQGTEFDELVAQTGGVKGDLCLQDFAPVFADIATQVIVDAEVDCDFAIPDPPAGQSLDFGKVNVAYSVDGGATVDLLQVPGGVAGCDASPGWYYDDPANPTLIVLCPSVCDTINSAQSSTIDVLFGCDTNVVPA